MAGKAEIARVAATARNTWENPFNFGTRGYWAVQDALFDRFVATHDKCIEELRELVRVTCGPVLDGTPESLGLLDEWLEIPVRLGPKWDDGADWLPVWTRISGNEEPFGDPGGMDIQHLYRLEGRVAFYYADVVISEFPGSKWVCWRAAEFNRVRTGEFLVDVGTFPTPCDPLGAAGGAIINAHNRLYGLTDPGRAPDRAHSLPGQFELEVAIRAKRLARTRLDFQGAPTGDEAGVGRGPYKGSRVKARIGQWRGYY
jgi:hypothetical protein